MLLYCQQVWQHLIGCTINYSHFFLKLAILHPNTTKCSWQTNVSIRLHPAIYSDTESFKFLQVVVEGLDVRKHTHRVRLVAHLQHVVHLDETQAVSLLPETSSGATEMLRIIFPNRGWLPCTCSSYSAVVKASPRLCLRLAGWSVL